MTPLSPTSPVATSIAAVGTALVVLMMVSQGPLYRSTILKKGSLATITVAPLIGMLFNMSAWSWYGFAIQDPNVINVNVAGVGIVLAFMLCQLFFNDTENRLRVGRIFAVASAVALGIEAGFFFGLSGTARSSCLAYFAIGCNVFLFASPIVALRAALKAMDSAALPVLLIVMNNACSAIWGVYGFLVADYFIMGPNIAGTALNLAQLAGAIYLARAGKSRGEKLDDEERLIDGIEGGVN
jgi:hypothetical protein